MTKKKSKPRYATAKSFEHLFNACCAMYNANQQLKRRVELLENRLEQTNLFIMNHLLCSSWNISNEMSNLYSKSKTQN